METQFADREAAERILGFVQDHYWTLFFSAWFISTFFVAPVIWRILYRRFDVPPVVRTAMAIGISGVASLVFIVSAMRPFSGS